MISATARAELRPRPIFILFRDWTDRPIRVEHVVLATLFEIRADAETRLYFDCAREPVLFVFQIAQRDVEHRHFHAARDVHAHGVWNYRIIRGKNTTDRQSVAN